jgi:prevent-host-death family protein
MNDKQVCSGAMRRDLRGLLDEVEHHDVHVTILRYEKPAAVLVSLEWYEQAKALIARSEMNGKETNHRDGDPLNNDPANLEIREPS